MIWVKIDVSQIGFYLLIKQKKLVRKEFFLETNQAIFPVASYFTQYAGEREGRSKKKVEDLNIFFCVLLVILEQFKKVLKIYILTS